MALTVQYTPQKEDYQDVLKAGTIHNQRHSWGNIGLIYIPLTGLSIYLYFQNQSLVSFWGYLLQIVLFIAPLLTFMNIYLNPLQSEKFISRDSKAFEPIAWVLAKSGITFDTSGEKTHLKWNFFHSVCETKKHYLLFHKENPNQFYFIPKRAFENKELENEFRGFVEEELGQITSVTGGERYYISMGLIAAAFIINILLLIAVEVHGV